MFIDTVVEVLEVFQSVIYDLHRQFLEAVSEGRSIDKIGIWLEHPGIVIQHMEDEKGLPLPPEQQSQEEIDAVFMVHWDNVKTLMHYPDRQGFDFPSQYRKKIGFRFKVKQESE